MKTPSYSHTLRSNHCKFYSRHDTVLKPATYRKDGCPIPGTQIQNPTPDRPSIPPDPPPSSSDSSLSCSSPSSAVATPPPSTRPATMILACTEPSESTPLFLVAAAAAACRVPTQYMWVLVGHPTYPRRWG